MSNEDNLKPGAAAAKVQPDAPLPENVPLKVRYQIRQMVYTAHRRWLEVVFDGEIERLALNEYERLKAEHPESYFELVMTVSGEALMRYTPLGSDGTRIAGHG